MKKIILALITIAFFSCKSEKQKLTEQIQLNEKKLFNDSTKMLIGNVADEELNAYKKFVEQFPQDTASPAYLFKAADLAHGMRRNKEAVGIYKEFLSKYPDNTKAAAGLFLEAFIYDNELKQKDSAKILYKQFLEKYPNNMLASSAMSSLDQIEMGLSDDDLMKMFEAKRDSAAKKP
jgi:TolA-binding protein